MSIIRSDERDNESDQESESVSESESEESEYITAALHRRLQFSYLKNEVQNELIIMCADSDAIFLVEHIYQFPEKLKDTQICCIQNEDGKLYSIKGLTTYSFPLRQLEQDSISFDEDEYEECGIPKYVWLFIYGYYCQRFNISNFSIRYAFVEYGKILGVYGYTFDTDGDKVFFKVKFPNNKEECSENSFQILTFSDRIMYVDFSYSDNDNMFEDSNCNCSNALFFRDASDIKISIVHAIFQQDFT